MKNLARINTYPQRQAARQDQAYVFNQLLAKGITPPLRESSLNKSAAQIDQTTRKVLIWAKDHHIKLKLPDGWK